MTYSIPSLAFLLAASFSAASVIPLQARQDVDSATAFNKETYSWKGESNGFVAKFNQNDSGSGSTSVDDLGEIAKQVTAYVDSVVKHTPDGAKSTQAWPGLALSYSTDQIDVKMAPTTNDTASNPFTIAEMAAFANLFGDFAGNIDGDVSLVDVAISNTPNGGTSFAKGTIVPRGQARPNTRPPPADILN